VPQRVPPGPGLLSGAPGQGPAASCMQRAACAASQRRPWWARPAGRPAAPTHLDAAQVGQCLLAGRPGRPGRPALRARRRHQDVLRPAARRVRGARVQSPPRWPGEGPRRLRCVRAPRSRALQQAAAAQQGRPRTRGRGRAERRCGRCRLIGPCGGGRRLLTKRRGGRRRRSGRRGGRAATPSWNIAKGCTGSRVSCPRRRGGRVSAGSRWQVQVRQVSSLLASRHLPDLSRARRGGQGREGRVCRLARPCGRRRGGRRRGAGSEAARCRHGRKHRLWDEPRSRPRRERRAAVAPAARRPYREGHARMLLRRAGLPQR